MSSSEQQQPPEGTLKSRQGLTSAAFSIGSLVLGVVSTIVAGSDKVLISYRGLISGFVLVLLGCIIAGILFQILLDIKHNLRQMSMVGQNVVNKVPFLVVFTYRHESISVSDDGDGVFECRHRVEYNGTLGNGIGTLNFPVIFDLKDPTAAPGSWIEVQSLTIDGKPNSTHGIYKAQEKRTVYSGEGGQTSGHTREYGIIQVPVNLNINNRYSEIHFRLLFKGVFDGSDHGDYVIVDIPYLTNSLVIRIHSSQSGSYIGRAVGKQNVEANCEMMELEDLVEGNFQSQNVRESQAYIEWRTDRAKIGYRYSLWFRSVKQPPKATSAPMIEG